MHWFNTCLIQVFLIRNKTRVYADVKWDKELMVAVVDKKGFMY